MTGNNDEIMDIETKYNLIEGDTNFINIFHPKLSQNQYEELCNVSSKIYQICECDGLVRIEYIMDHAK